MPANPLTTLQIAHEPKHTDHKQTPARLQHNKRLPTVENRPSLLLNDPKKPLTDPKTRAHPSNQQKIRNHNKIPHKLTAIKKRQIKPISIIHRIKKWFNEYDKLHPKIHNGSIKLIQTNNHESR